MSYKWPTPNLSRRFSICVTDYLVSYQRKGRASEKNRQFQGEEGTPFSHWKRRFLKASVSIPGVWYWAFISVKWVIIGSNHYGDVIVGAIESQITSLTIVYSIVHSDAHQRKHQSSASLAFVRGIHRGPVNSPHKWPVTRKMFPFDDVIMNGLVSVL